MKNLNEVPRDSYEREAFLEDYLVGKEAFQMNWSRTFEWLQKHQDADPGGNNGPDLFDMPLPSVIEEYRPVQLSTDFNRFQSVSTSSAKIGT